MVLLKVLAVLAVIIFLLRRRAPVSVAMLAGILALGLAFSPSVGRFVQATWLSASDPRTLDLMAVVALVLILSHLLHESGQFKRMMEALGGVVTSSRVRLAAMPALIGLLPMPGGARFSAPMVEAAGDGMGLNAHRLSLINYWYRHIWEYSWPLYPGILLASEFLPAGGVLSLSIAQFPLTLTAVIAGLIFVLPHDLPKASLAPKTSGRRRAAIRDLIVNASPIFVVVLVFGGMSVLADAAGMAGANRPQWIPKNLPMTVGLVTASAVVILLNRMGLTPVGNYAFRRPDLAKMMLMVLSVFVFAGLFKHLGASKQLGEYLRAAEIPPVAVAVALPFAIGLLTSVTYVYVALAFPLVVALVPNGGDPRPFLVLAFCFGFLGCLFSPLHLCLLLTKEYFQADFKPIYRDLIAPIAMVAAAGVVLFLLLR